MRDIFDLTALELGAAIRKGEVSPTQAAQAALKRMEETKENGAFVAVTADRALDRAREIEKQMAAGGAHRPPGRGAYGAEGQHLHQRRVHHLRQQDLDRLCAPL